VKVPWTPVGAHVSYAPLPPLGATIGLAHRAWRVVSIEPLDPDDWVEQDHAAWERYGRDVPWRLAPARVSLVEVKGGKTQGVRHETIVRPWAGGCWYLLYEHYAICAVCGEVCPCRHVETQRNERAREERAEQIRSVPAGSCIACGTVVTGRQRSISFEGENLLAAGGPPAIFHLRRECRESAIAYERKWVAAHPWRRAQLNCAGNLVHHVRGDVCSETDCPGGDARHMSWERCTVAECADAHRIEAGRVGGPGGAERNVGADGAGRLGGDRGVPDETSGAVGAPIGPAMGQGLRLVEGVEGRP